MLHFHQFDGSRLSRRGGRDQLNGEGAQPLTLDLYKQHLITEQIKIVPDSFPEFDQGHCSLITRGRDDLNCYRLHSKIYATGDVKAVAVKLRPEDKERSPGGYKRKNKSRDDMDDLTVKKSYQRSRSTATDLSIQKGLDQLLTLTTREIIPFDSFDQAFRLFLRNMRKRYGKNFKYVAVLEYQKRGALHAHLGVQGFYMWNTVRRIWNNALEHYGLGDGNIDFTKPKKHGYKSWNAKNIANYICKYITKSDITDFNKKRYWSGGPTVALIRYMGYIGVGLPMHRMLAELIDNLSGRKRSTTLFEIDDYFNVIVLTT